MLVSLSRSREWRGAARRFRKSKLASRATDTTRHLSKTTTTTTPTSEVRAIGGLAREALEERVQLFAGLVRRERLPSGKTSSGTGCVCETPTKHGRTSSCLKATTEWCSASAWNSASGQAASWGKSTKLVGASASACGENLTCAWRCATSVTPSTAARRPANSSIASDESTGNDSIELRIISCPEFKQVCECEHTSGVGPSFGSLQRCSVRTSSCSDIGSLQLYALLQQMESLTPGRPMLCYPPLSSIPFPSPRDMGLERLSLLKSEITTKISHRRATKIQSLRLDGQTCQMNQNMSSR